MTLGRILLCLQLGTFVGLGTDFIIKGHPRLGVAQLLLAVVQAVIYS